MIIIQFILVAFAVVLAARALGSRSTHSVKAWKKIGLILLVAAFIVAVLFPELTNDLAHVVGVGRGADLLLYTTVIIFIFYVLNNYLHQQDQRDVLFRLARRVALLEAEEQLKDRK